MFQCHIGAISFLMTSLWLSICLPFKAMTNGHIMARAPHYLTDTMAAPKIGPVVRFFGPMGIERPNLMVVLV